jgi:hypothetical protein
MHDVALISKIMNIEQFPAAAQERGVLAPFMLRGVLPPPAYMSGGRAGLSKADPMVGAEGGLKEIITEFYPDP